MDELSGTLVTGGDRPAVRLERLIPKTTDSVWRALTVQLELASWFPCGVSVANEVWEVGAALAFQFPPEIIDLELSGQVVDIHPPSLLTYTWGEELLSFELAPAREGTHVFLTNELAPEAAARNAAGWETCLDRLEGISPDPKAWPERFAFYTARFEPILGHQEGPPPGYNGG